MNKNNQIIVLSLFIAAALVGSLLTSTSTDAFRTKNKSNEALQDIGQSSATGQNSTCSSETGTTLSSCNNVALSFNLNDGSNALGQQ